MSGIRALADYLDLSVGTVSRALNDRPDVNKETRSRVLKAAQEIGYVPNQAGRSLRLGKTGIIGFFVNSSEMLASSSGQFFVSIIDGMQTELSSFNIDIVVFPVSRDEDSVGYLERIARRHIVDGVVIAETRPEDPRIEFLEAARIPFITFGRSEIAGDYNWLDFDFEGAAGMSVDRLVRAGHTNIGIAATNEDRNYVNLTIEGFQRALARHGLSCPPHKIFRCDPSESAGLDVGYQLLKGKDQTTAMVSTHPQIIGGIYTAFESVGRIPGRDIECACVLRCGVEKVRDVPLIGLDAELDGLGATLANMLLSRLPGFKTSHAEFRRNILWPGKFDPAELMIAEQHTSDVLKMHARRG